MEIFIICMYKYIHYEYHMFTYISICFLYVSTYV